MTEQQHIEQQGIQDFFAMIPNLVDDADLDVYEFRLLVHYYRVGNCWQSTNTTAVICHMSKPQVVEKRRSLAGKGWIKIIKGDAQDSLSITVIDKWDENHKRYAGLSKDAPPHMATEKSSGKQHDRQGVTQINGTGQDVVSKNIPINKTTNIMPEPIREDIDSEGNPVAPKKPTKKQRERVPEAVFKPIAFALGEVMGWDMKISSNFATVGRAARELSLAGYTDENIRSVFGKGGAWYRRDWRGQKGQSPTLSQITREISSLSKPAQNNGGKATAQERLERRMAKFGK